MKKMAKRILGMGILAMALVFGMTVIGCGGGGSTNGRSNVSVTVNVTANGDGEIYIAHNGGLTIGSTSSINVTTDLEYPNDSFTLVFGNGGSRSITGLTANQVVEVTLTAFTRQISPSVLGNRVYIFVSDL